MTAPRTSAQTALLRAVHDQPGATRASISHELGIPSGFAAETVARLVAARLLIEEPAPPTGARGRPTTSLQAHPDGPVVAVAAISQETWQVAAVQLGGTQISSVSGIHDRRQERVLAVVAAGLNEISARFGPRVRATAVSVPGTVVGSRLASAPNLGWHDVDLSALWPRYDRDVPLLAGNDATFAAIAESRHGAGSGAGTMVYLHFDAGVGGAIVEGDRVVLGANGTAGEFGHMPFGDPAQRCRCGAMGCWNTSLDGYALARALGQPMPADEVSYLRRVLAAAADAPAGGCRRGAGRRPGVRTRRRRAGQRARPAPDRGRRPRPGTPGRRRGARHCGLSRRADGLPHAAAAPAGPGPPAGRRPATGRGRAVLRPGAHGRGPGGLDVRRAGERYRRRGSRACAP